MDSNADPPKLAPERRLASSASAWTHSWPDPLYAVQRRRFL